MSEKVLESKLTGVSVRLLHQSQLKKLAFKTEAELEYLDTIREYMARRTEIENAYANSLKKLSKSTAAKKFRKYFGGSPMPLNIIPPQQEPDGVPDLTVQSRVMYMAMAQLLNQADIQSKQFNELSDTINAIIADKLKEFSKQKIIQAKKTTEFGVKNQAEIAVQYDEIEKIKIKYDKAAKDADSANRKYDEALKKPKSGLRSLKTMMTGKDEASIVQKLKTKSKNKTRTLNEVRNEYLLALAGLNASQEIYDKEELPKLMEKFDGSYYENVKSFMQSYLNYQESQSKVLMERHAALKPSVDAINRATELNQFLVEHQTIFKPSPPIPFEPSNFDSVKTIVADEVTKISLGKYLGRLVTLDEKITTLKAIKETELAGANNLVTIYTESPESGNPAHPLELIFDLQNQIDEYKSKKHNLQAQIKLLKELHIEPIIEESKGNQMATITVAFQASEEGQIDVHVGEEVEILETNGQFIKILNSSGNTGSIPAANVKNIDPVPKSTTNNNIVVVQFEYKATEEGELSLMVGDEIECIDGIDIDEEWWEGKIVSTGAVGIFPVKFTKGWEAVARANSPTDIATLARQLSVLHRGSVALQNKRQSAAVVPTSHLAESIKDNESIIEEGFSARVLYDYEASCEGELTIEVGEIISGIITDTGSDAWWEGTGKKGRGQFPKNYVIRTDLNVPAVKFKALYDYASTNPGDLTFNTGDIIMVTQSTEADWWDGVIGNRAGAFPAAYVERIIE